MATRWEVKSAWHHYVNVPTSSLDHYIQQALRPMFPVKRKSWNQSKVEVRKYVRPDRSRRVINLDAEYNKPGCPDCGHAKALHNNMPCMICKCKTKFN